MTAMITCGGHSLAFIVVVNNRILRHKTCAPVSSCKPPSGNGIHARRLLFHQARLLQHPRSSLDANALARDGAERLINSCEPSAPAPRNNNKPRRAASFKGRRRRARLPRPCPKMTSLMLPPCNIESIDRLGTCPPPPRTVWPKSLDNPTIPQTKKGSSPGLNWCARRLTMPRKSSESSTHPPPKGCTRPDRQPCFHFPATFSLFLPLCTPYVHSSAEYPEFPSFFSWSPADWPRAQ